MNTESIQCRECKEIIPADTMSRLVFCSCGLVGVDGNGLYTRILGEDVDYLLKEGSATRIHDAVKRSSMLEGMDFDRAIQNKKVVKRLQKKGRGFSV